MPKYWKLLAPFIVQLVVTCDQSNVPFPQVNTSNDWAEISDNEGYDMPFNDIFEVPDDEHDDYYQDEPEEDHGAQNIPQNSVQKSPVKAETTVTVTVTTPPLPSPNTEDNSEIRVASVLKASQTRDDIKLVEEPRIEESKEGEKEAPRSSKTSVAQTTVGNEVDPARRTVPHRNDGSLPNGGFEAANNTAAAAFVTTPPPAATANPIYPSSTPAPPVATANPIYPSSTPAPPAATANPIYTSSTPAPPYTHHAPAAAAERPQYNPKRRQHRTTESTQPSYFDGSPPTTSPSKSQPQPSDNWAPSSSPLHATSVVEAKPRISKLAVVSIRNSVGATGRALKLAAFRAVYLLHVTLHPTVLFTETQIWLALAHGNNIFTVAVDKVQNVYQRFHESTSPQHRPYVVVLTAVASISTVFFTLISQRTRKRERQRLMALVEKCSHDADWSATGWKRVYQSLHYLREGHDKIVGRLTELEKRVGSPGAISMSQPTPMEADSNAFTVGILPNDSPKVEGRSFLLENHTNAILGRIDNLETSMRRQGQALQHMCDQYGGVVQQRPSTSSISDVAGQCQSYNLERAEVQTLISKVNRMHSSNSQYMAQIITCWDAFWESYHSYRVPELLRIFATERAVPWTEPDLASLVQRNASIWRGSYKDTDSRADASTIKNEPLFITHSDLGQQVMDPLLTATEVGVGSDMAGEQVEDDAIAGAVFESRQPPAAPSNHHHAGDSGGSLNHEGVRVAFPSHAEVPLEKRAGTDNCTEELDDGKTHFAGMPASDKTFQHQRCEESLFAPPVTYKNDGCNVFLNPAKTVPTPLAAAATFCANEEMDLKTATNVGPNSLNPMINVEWNMRRLPESILCTDAAETSPPEIPSDSGTRRRLPIAHEDSHDGTTMQFSEARSVGPIDHHFARTEWKQPNVPGTSVAESTVASQRTALPVGHPRQIHTPMDPPQPVYLTGQYATKTPTNYANQTDRYYQGPEVQQPNIPTPGPGPMMDTKVYAAPSTYPPPNYPQAQWNWS